MKLTIILPTYNEAENLPKLVPALLALDMPELRLLIVDDNSPDGTGQLADEFAEQHPDRIKVIHREGKGGLGSAYRFGFRVAIEDGAEAIAQMDSDFSHPVEKLPEMLAALSECDVVIGSRYVPGGSVDHDWPLWRKGLSAWGNFYARAILNVPVRDVTGGFRIWRKETLEGLPMERVVSNGYIFQVELAHITHRLGFQFKEIPIYFADRKWGTSKMNFKIQVEAALRVWQVRFAYRDLRPIV